MKCTISSSCYIIILWAACFACLGLTFGSVAMALEINHHWFIATTIGVIAICMLSCILDDSHRIINKSTITMRFCSSVLTDASTEDEERGLNENPREYTALRPRADQILAA